MASKGNNFAASEGGAMLTNKSSAQSSFGMQNLGKNNAMRPPSGGQATNNGQGLPNNAQNGAKENELQNGQQESAADQAQKEALKKAGETALSAAGVPQPVSKKIIDKAEETGALDKINEEINNFKKKAVMKLLPMLAPVIGWVFMLVIIINVISAVIGPAAETVENIVNFFEAAWGVTTDLASGIKKEEKFFLAHFPDKSYVDKVIEQKESSGISAAEIESAKKEEIRKLANIWASIAAPIYYRMEELETNKWNNSDFLSYSVYDVCSLAYSSLKNANGVTYYQNVINTNSDVTDIKGAIPKIGCNELSDFEKFLNGFSNWNPVTDDIQDLVTEISGAISSKTLASSLATNTLDYDFNSQAYNEYLKKYYLNKRYSNYIEEYKKENNLSSDEEALNYYSNMIEIYQQVYYDAFLDKLTENFYPVGSSAEEDLVSSLGSIYGENSCAILDNYNPLTHEYTESQGVTNNEIHSVSDGEVIYVKNDSKNLYEHWDLSKQKCICNGITCNDYDGNQIKIKFIVDDVEFIATYSNLDTINVNVGDIVTKGQIIATEGNTGCTNMKKLKFQLTSESGINYNTNELLENCSSTSSTINACNFNNIKINIVDCSDNLIKTLPLYEYVKEKLYFDFKVGIEEPELLKAGAVSIASNILANNNYKVGVNEITIKDCNYKNVNISAFESLKLDKAINEIRGQIITYTDKIIAIRYNLVCNRTEKDENANSVYNSMCVNKALELAISGKSYTEILEIYYPNYQLNKNYCLNYASLVNKYSMNNKKNYLSVIEDTELNKLNKDLDSRINMVGYGTRAAVVEAARYLVLGLEGKIPYRNGGKYFEIGINPNWASLGIDSSGFVSWVLLNGGANINETLTISKLVKSAYISGNIKINSDLYRYYDKIQVGDFAYREDRIGIIIGKNDGILYVAEANINDGLIVKTISSYGSSESNYTHIYFADNYYNGTGNVTSMW